MTKIVRALVFAATASLVGTGIGIAQQQLNVDINRITDAGIGDKIGTAVLSESKKGVSIKLAVTGVPKGSHGFHIHDKGDCSPAMKAGKMTAGEAAGPHYDPDMKQSHKGPRGEGHKGDLPVVTADAKGIKQTVTANRLKLDEVRGRSLVIHEASDNYTDTPENGGSKGRIACGVIPK